jgi:CheY-like chemotaxis protein
VAKTLLAVDDSVTMRRVLEITFSGEDFRVLTAESSQAALGKLGENPQVCLIDTVLGGEDGYAVAKEIKKRHPGAAIMLLSSRYAPYDQARGRDAGADDWADKPFDTQQLIDKVRRLLTLRESAVAAPPPPAASPPAPLVAPPPPRPPVPIAAQPLTKGTQPSLSGAIPPQVRAGATLAFGETPRPEPVAAKIAASPPAPPVVQQAVNGHLAGKLGDLGLTPQQAEAVLALSREVVERVVWEVVPQLAETIIKEEIARLTKD